MLIPDIKISTLNDYLENKKFILLTILILLIVVSSAFRVLPAWEIVFPGDGFTHLVGVDSYFYLRSAEYTAVNFPEIFRADLYSFYPRGSSPDSSGLFSLVLAFLALLVNGFRFNENITEITAAWFPVLLNAVTFIILFKSVKRLTNNVFALLAVLIYIIFPDEALTKSVLGFCDQHVAEILLGVSWIYGLTAGLDYTKSENKLKNWLSIILYPMPLALLAFTWQGSYMHYGILGVVIAIYMNLAILYDEDLKKLSVNILRYGAGLLIWLLTVNLLYPSLIPPLFNLEESVRFIIVIIITLGAFIYLRCALVLLTRRMSKVTIVIIGLGIIAGAFYYYVEYSERGSWMFNQLFYRRSGLVAEQLQMTWIEFFNIFGVAGLLSIIALPLLIILGKYYNNLRLMIIPIIFGLSLILIWMKTSDFNYMGPIGVAILSTFSFYGLYIFSTTKRTKKVKKYKQRLKKKSKQKFEYKIIITVLNYGLFVLMFIWPFFIGYTQWHNTDDFRYNEVHTHGWFEAMDWMKNNTPDVDVGLNTSVSLKEYRQDSLGLIRSGMYGVLSSWDFGNFIAVKGKRPALYARYPVGNSPKWMLETDENKSLNLLCPGCDSLDNVKYVVMDSRMVGSFFLPSLALVGDNDASYLTFFNKARKQDGKSRDLYTYGEKYNNSVGVRLYKFNGRNLGKFRLVFESEHQTYLTYHAFEDNNELSIRLENFQITDESKYKEYKNLTNFNVMATPKGHYYNGVIESSVKIFEVVNGANITGNTIPLKKVIAEIHLFSQNTGRTLKYTNETLSDADGNFELTLPYSTESEVPQSSVHAEGAYIIFFEEVPGIKRILYNDLEISELQVREGSIINLD
ncbi:hypothetical protein ACFLS9_06255 [Bacteroidota bacterium]